MLSAFTAMIVGIALLVWGADRFVDGAASIARNLRVSPMIIGLTIVSLGTSLPEMIVSAIAAMDGNNNLGIGNVLGSNIANIGLVLGITALIIPLSVQSMTLRREMPVLLLITMLALLLMADGDLNFFDGVILFVGSFLLVAWITRIGLADRHDPLVEEFTESIPDAMPMARSIMWFIVGLLILIASSRMVVWGAVEIAHYFGVSDLIIGLTIVAIGTSLPELVASITGALKNEADLAIGNVIGSNMFNLLIVLSMPGLIAPGTFEAQALLRDFPIMIAFTIALFVVSFGRSGGRITRVEGGLLTSGFIAYLYLLYLQA
ncbi:MAG: calcium/sodium antiporter [Zetaproteobacteria bacterium CG_4_9_14_3_um_filter_49_83]|nr:MAG: calcium/sodium antiporter [Zetaproteobacteria bacterium CG1_02_49_23]PIQ31285.1 MAG: calcium/sodium antiporter [Zetaproteobacteria bacterium CG17_big_fil_post_rev_8_21_14_2_50_50_13]PIV30588.1 MAG: calcium/sodium antiporter [Zetaproteobacteria bacterium CG02_land_8_20_14_3_00_50_9]PIY55603.1 MAG: calcium/sodium antiporter [Zetaproteobacteria bacterium CG_4_10_14_0_8_um_filter_49_80]PJA35495.1 MAG: calcium/sodium antiporter [Zetaproteobacteria bacterium CG_4_9_14_3_um_filter_49_83]